MATNNSISIFQGNNFAAVVPVYNTKTGEQVDISAYSAVLTIKKKVKDTAHVLQKSLSIQNNVIVMELTKEETLLAPGSYIYDVVITYMTNRKTVVQSGLQILDSVSF